MAGDPLNAPGFSIPSLTAYQSALKQQAVNNALQTSNGWNYQGALAKGLFELTRAAGFLTPEEKKIAQANQIQQDAVRQTTASDPVEARRQQLAYMAQKFNAVGLTDLTAQVMPELNALQQRQIELRKLGAETTTAESNATVAAATEAARIVEPYVKNENTVAQTGEAGAGTALKHAQAGALESEGQTYFKMGKDGQPVYQTIPKVGPEAAQALQRAGWNPVSLSVAAGTGAGLGGPPKQEQEKLMEVYRQSQDQFDQATASMSNYDPKFLQRMTQFNFARLAEQEKLGLPMSATDRGSLTQYTRFRTDVATHLNQYIQNMTGKQMSLTEATRLLRAVPNAETDSNTQFLSKMHETIKFLMGVQKRSADLLKGDPNYTVDPASWDHTAIPSISDAEVDAYMNARMGIRPSPTDANPSANPRLAPPLVQPTTPPAGGDWHQLAPGIRIKARSST